MTILSPLPPDLQAIITPALDPNGSEPTVMMLYRITSEYTKAGARWVRDAARAGWELIPTPEVQENVFAIYTVQDRRLVGAWVYNPVDGHIGRIQSGHPPTLRTPTKIGGLTAIRSKQKIAEAPKRRRKVR